MNWWQRLRVRVPQTRYEAEWDLYSREWEGKVREVDEVHLGDGWATPSFTMQIVERFCRPYLKQKLMCLDVSEAMLARTRERLSDRPNVRLVKGDGLTLRPLARPLGGVVKEEWQAVPRHEEPEEGEPQARRVFVVEDPEQPGQPYRDDQEPEDDHADHVFRVRFAGSPRAQEREERAAREDGCPDRGLLLHLTRRRTAAGSTRPPVPSA